MTARSLLPRKSPLLPLPRHLSSHQTTGLQFRQLQYASKKAPKVVRAKKVALPPAAVAKTTSPVPPMKYFSLSESLGSSGKESIMLYTCNNRLFIVGCYGLATGMVAWSVHVFYTNIVGKRPGIPQWVVSTTYVSISAMMLLAGLVAYFPTRIVQVIHAHPIPGAARTPPRVSITLHKRPILPTLPLQKIRIASPDLITLGEPFHPLHAAKPNPIPETEDMRSTAAKIRHGITRAPSKVFGFFRSALSTGGFVLLKVEGVGNFRISKDGWVWEWRGLDRLFKATRRVYLR